MDLRTNEISLTDDLNITVHEADATFDARKSSVQRQIDEIRKQKDYDQIFLLFLIEYYGTFLACSNGNVPSGEQAFKLPRETLDKWFLSIWELNPEDLGEYIPEEKTVDIELRDGSRIVVHQSRNLPSYVLKLYELEKNARDNDSRYPSDQHEARWFLYPHLAACSTGDVPTPDEFVTYPRSEVARWGAVAMQLNKRWWDVIFENADQVLEAEKQSKKKVRKRSAKSSAG